MKLKELRTQKGMSQESLANHFKVSRSTIAMWETSKAQPDSETLCKLAEYFETSIDYLVGRTDFTDEENEKICQNLKKHLSPHQTTYIKGDIHYIIPGEMLHSIFKNSYKFSRETLSSFLDIFDITETDCLQEDSEKKLPDTEHPLSKEQQALIDSYSDLSPDDLKDVMKYIEFLKSRHTD